MIGYVADVGKVEGKRLKPFFKTEAEAQKFLESHGKNKPTTEAVLEHRIEFLHAYQRLQTVGASITEAVDFFLKHGARKGNPEIQKVLDSLLETKRQSGRKQSYIDSLNKHLSKFVAVVGGDTKIGNITDEQVIRYVYKHYSHANEVTKLNVIRNLSVLFNFAINKKFIGINPVLGVEKPEERRKKPKVLTPEDMTTLLNRCFKKQWHNRLTVYVLVGFCGVRTEEATQMSWSNIDLAKGTVEVPFEIAKKMGWRTNRIQPNALAWLRAIEDKRRTGLIIGSNSVSLLRTAVKYAHINHSKNCIRHSFCSYALGAGWDLADVLADMGHNGSPNTIAKYYRNVVEPSDSKRWWAISPPPTSPS